MPDQPYRPKLIVDAHLDLATNALGARRDLRRSAYSRRERGSLATRIEGKSLVGLPELVRGRVGVVFGTIFTMPARNLAARAFSALTQSPVMYRDAEEAHQSGTAQLDFYRRWADQEPHVKLIGTRRDLEDVVGDWGEEKRVGHRIGIVPLMEGADPILEPKELERWVERGVRIVGPAWRATRYSAGTGEPGGLTSLGRELLEVMAALNVILDVSHMAQQALFEALDRFEGKHLIASHSNPQRLMPTDRHLPDEAIERIAERGGVIGVVLFNKFLKKGWGTGSKKREVTLDDVVRAVDTICQITGSADHAGIGSDFDGGFGADATPLELDSSRDLWKIGAELRRRGYAVADVDKIMSGNWLRVLRAALPES
jgi:membrane dipeptidase